MKLFISFIILLAIPIQAFAYTAYVHSYKATVYSSPLMKSKKIDTLSKGAQLEITAQKGVWLKVKKASYPKKTGWIYKFMVKKQPVKKSGKLYSKLKSFFYSIESISKKSRRRPSSYTSTAAARGLREKRRHFAEKYKSDYDALEKIEAIEISESEAMEFLWKGVKNENDL